MEYETHCRLQVFALSTLINMKKTLREESKAEGEEKLTAEFQTC